MDNDATTIPNDARLYRRVNPVWVVYDKNKGERRPSSQNFQNSKDGSAMSVFAENIAIANGETPADFLRGRWSTWFLAAVTAGSMRELGQRVYLDTSNQDPDDWHPSHAVVDGPKPAKIRPKLGERSEWVVPPPDRYDPDH